MRRVCSRYKRLYPGRTTALRRSVYFIDEFLTQLAAEEKNARDE